MLRLFPRITKLPTSSAQHQRMLCSGRSFYCWAFSSLATPRVIFAKCTAERYARRFIYYALRVSRFCSLATHACIAGLFSKRCMHSYHGDYFAPSDMCQECKKRQERWRAEKVRIGIPANRCAMLDMGNMWVLLMRVFDGYLNESIGWLHVDFSIPLCKLKINHALKANCKSIQKYRNSLVKIKINKCNISCN